MTALGKMKGVQDLAAQAGWSPDSSQQGEADELRHYLHVVLRYKTKIVLLALVITALVALFVYAQTPMYQSTATMLIESSPAKIISIEEMYGLETSNREYFLTQFEILRSRELAARLVDALGLVHHPEFQPGGDGFSWRRLIPEGMAAPPVEPDEQARRQAVIAAVMGRLSVNPVRNSQLVEISFAAFDRELAARMANAYVDIYIENDLDARLQMTRRAASWLTGRLEDLRVKLEASEKALQAYREQNDLVDIEGVSSTIAMQHTAIMGQLVAARGELSRAQNLFQQLEQLKGSPLQEYEKIPSVFNHPLMQTARSVESAAERKVAELSKRYGPKHPKMIAAMTELQAARSNRKKELAGVIEALSAESRIAQASVRDIEQELATVNAAAQDINRKEYQLQVLQRDVAGNRQLYDMFLTRFKEADVSDDLQSVIARMVDPAVVSTSPFKPRKGMVIGTTLLLALLLSMLLALLLDYLDNTFKGNEDVEEKLGLPVLGGLPVIETSKGEDGHDARRFVLDHQDSIFAEAVRSVRTGVLLSGLDAPHKVVLVTSSVPGEGKSTLSVNLAAALSHMERVLLIDADMRRPSVGGVCGLQERHPGLSDFVAGTHPLEDCISQCVESSLAVMPSGIIPPNPLELLSSRRFVEVIEQLSEHYERIVIDSAPAQAVSDALMISRLASAVLYVVKADSTGYRVAQQGIKRLRQVDAPLLGVVLNQLDVKKAGSGYGKYAYYTGDSYTHYGYSRES